MEAPDLARKADNGDALTERERSEPAVIANVKRIFACEDGKSERLLTTTMKKTVLRKSYLY